MTSPTPHARRVRRLAAAVLVAGLAVTTSACGSSGSDAATSTTSTTTPIEKASYFKPPLPSNLNAIPFLKGDLAALGNVKLRVDKVTDPGTKKGAKGTRTVVITTQVTNGALTELTLKPETFLAYVATGTGTTADPDPAITKPLASGEVRSLPLTFEVPADGPLVFLTFNGEPYGDRVNNGLIAVDPKYTLPKADN